MSLRHLARSGQAAPEVELSELSVPKDGEQVADAVVAEVEYLVLGVVLNPHGRPPLS